MLEFETIRAAPKALLHDHLDGGLRPETVIELAAEIGYDGLPTSDPAELARWFLRDADRKSLELYLERFRHTIALLQTRDAIERVAAECAEDLAADNVVYAEVRYAPELSTEGGLTLLALQKLSRSSVLRSHCSRLEGRQPFRVPVVFPS
jgi:adenosine deaminase